ncbi:hypothetical protein VTI74DRAFT_4789 [Chaetomium olivicolor]
MSSNEKQQPTNPAAQQGPEPYFPPPPPGPPPIQTSQAQPPKHSNETPLPDYDIPAYNPVHPQFAAPPSNTDDNIYDATPTEEHPPKWGFHHHHQESDGEAKKKKGHRLSALGDAFASKVSGPVNALAHKFGSEGFLPEALDKECEKAARILRAFCKDGIYSDVPVSPLPTTTPSTTDKPPASPGAKPKKSRALLTIPSKVIARAQGLAIFTAVRLGFQATGSSGSGILIARLPDGSWSPPSGIQITSIGAGFVAGVDIYDCVIVINTKEALNLFTKTRLSLGSDLAVTAGPFGAGGALDWGVPAGDKADRPVSRGRDGTQKVPAPATLSPPPLSEDKTHFTTPAVPEDQQGMGEEDDNGKDKKKDKINRRPSPFREAIMKPVYSYVKSRGFYAGVQIDGTVIAEREGANTKFYGAAIPAAKILRGEVPVQGPPGMWRVGAKGLFEVLKGAAEGWRGAQGQSPVSPGFPTAGTAPYTTSAAAPAPAPVYGAPAGTGGAPPSTWVPPPPPASTTTGATVPGVTAGVQNLTMSGGAGPSTAFPPPPPGPPPSAAASAKAAEAAAEAARAEPIPPPPPMYSEAVPGQGLGQEHGQSQARGGVEEDLPPAYVEDERYRSVSGDSKTGQH